MSDEDEPQASEAARENYRRYVAGLDAIGELMKYALTEMDMCSDNESFADHREFYQRLALARRVKGLTA